MVIQGHKAQTWTWFVTIDWILLGQTTAPAPSGNSPSICLCSSEKILRASGGQTAVWERSGEMSDVTQTHSPWTRRHKEIQYNCTLMKSTGVCILLQCSFWWTLLNLQSAFNKTSCKKKKKNPSHMLWKHLLYPNIIELMKSSLWPTFLSFFFFSLFFSFQVCYRLGGSKKKLSLQCL